MKLENLEQTITLPEGVKAQTNKFMLTITGPKGELTRRFASKRVVLEQQNNELAVKAALATKKEKMLLNTFAAHIKNMIRGVTEGHNYELKICSGHFPMNVSLKGDVFEVKNFIGEAVPRTTKIPQGSEVKVEGDKITVSGIDKELVAQTAARMENLTKRPGFDTRIFQDGIFIVNKDGKEL